MGISVSDSTKHLLARYGPNKLFGNDIDERRELDQAAGITLFDRVWKERLERLIMDAEACDSQEAYPRLTESQQQYFDFDQQHRAFRVKELNAEFIAQLLDHGNGDLELTQFWRVSSSDTHPKTLFVTFESVEAREQFRRVANNLGIHDEQLGLQLCNDFMAKFPARFREDRV